MKPQDRLLLAFARQHLTEAHRVQIERLCSEHVIDWAALFRQAEAHRIAPLVGHHLQGLDPDALGIPPPVQRQFKLAQYSSALLQERRRRMLVEALRFFREAGIRAMLIKGGALAEVVYAFPWLTVSEDIDLVLDVRRSEIDEATHRLFERRLHGSGIEFDYFEHHDVTLNGVLPVDFQRIWAEARPLALDGETVYVMRPEDLVLSLCINSCRKRYLRVKSLFDIAETLLHYRPALEWQVLAERAKRYRCNNIVYTALLTVQRTVGGEIAAAMLDALHVPRGRALLIRGLLGTLLRTLSLGSVPPRPQIPPRELFGRQVELSLLLVYATYSPWQAWAKARQAVAGRAP